MIVKTQQLVDFLEKIRPESGPAVCAIDTEADSLHRYQESLCLIQFAVRGESLLIDPLAIEDLSPLGHYLQSATVWMHGADYDMTMFKREFGLLPPTVFDTQIGARLLGVKRFGLGDLVEHYFGVTLSKSSQKADWGKRPLSQKMIEYALNDVDYLLEMSDKIVAQLRDLGRYEWFVESCEAARQKVLDRSDSKDELWRIQGSGKLTRLGMAYLKGLWHWRDAEAKAWDRPSFMVSNNRQLLEWSDELAKGKRIQFPGHYRPDRVKRLHATLAAVKALPESDWPVRPATQRHKRDNQFDARLESMIQSRNTVAESLDIDSSLIASRAVLELLAAEQATPEELLLQWQRQCLNL